MCGGSFIPVVATPLISIFLITIGYRIGTWVSKIMKGAERGIGLSSSIANTLYLTGIMFLYYYLLFLVFFPTNTYSALFMLVLVPGLLGGFFVYFTLKKIYSTSLKQFLISYIFIFLFMLASGLLNFLIIASGNTLC